MFGRHRAGAAVFTLNLGASRRGCRRWHCIRFIQCRVKIIFDDRRSAGFNWFAVATMIAQQCACARPKNCIGAAVDAWKLIDGCRCCGHLLVTVAAVTIDSAGGPFGTCLRAVTTVAGDGAGRASVTRLAAIATVTIKRTCCASRASLVAVAFVAVEHNRCTGWCYGHVWSRHRIVGRGVRGVGWCARHKTTCHQK